MEQQKRVLEDYLNSAEKVTCEKCGKQMAERQMAKNMFICPLCGKYNHMPARVRIEEVVNPDSFRELFCEEIFEDPLRFPDYGEKHLRAKEASGENEGVVCGIAKIGDVKTCIFVMESKFMMGSMGTVVGDKIAALFEYAVLHELPVIGYTVSGGARMQEGILSLIQMAKVSAAAKKHSDARLFYLVCATDPTMGGITASYAMLGDVIIAEPEARIGFAGKRVIEQVTGEILPENFQSAEFQMQNGFLDGIVPREQHRAYLRNLLSLH